ncbi:DUF3224 domain-containing protein [Actinomycetospora endophytica]|uniref:DUF3224 domain-containing protein n=1 Tax=Actinomycetospora endophytica TaxID=2291215 RepID=A0ABS8P671_9PSEU|nr:DUF3224 domain-containing protein [Actinomycetospora endophytica]MCD2193731.1 DUF3224 domain-containing protein [Actinomycetospora endophytica]
MRTSGTFSVASFEPTDVTGEPAITTALPIGVARMEKSYEGDVRGRSATLFTAAFDQATGQGTYLAMEAFEGSLGGREGTFAYVHSATTSGTDRSHEFFLVVPGSGTGALAGISGGGSMGVDADGTHRIAFDYELEPAELG